VADVRRRLFSWSPVEADVQAVTVDDTGVQTFIDPTRKAIVRPDTGAILGIFRTGYKVHDYDRWLITNVEGLLDADPADRVRRSAAWGSGGLGAGRDGRHPQRRRGG